MNHKSPTKQGTNKKSFTVWSSWQRSVYFTKGRSHIDSDSSKIAIVLVLIMPSTFSSNSALISDRTIYVNIRKN